MIAIVAKEKLKSQSQVP